jgi:hypothetical protein
VKKGIVRDVLWSYQPVPGSLDKKGERRCHLLLNKRWNLLPHFLSNEPGTVLKDDFQPDPDPTFYFIPYFYKEFLLKMA